MGVILDARHEFFLTSLFIQLFCNNYLRGGIGSMLKRSAREKDKGNSACTLLSLYAYTYAWTTRHFVVMFCLRDVLSVCFLFCFVLFDCLFVCLFVCFLINEASWWTWDSQIRWCLEIPSMTQARPHCAFSWLLDKLRWTQAMVLLSHIFWSKIGSGFSEPDSTPPPRIFRSTPWETWSLVASLPVSIHSLIIKCFNDLHDLYDHDKFYVCL